MTAPAPESAAAPAAAVAAARPTPRPRWGVLPVLAATVFATGLVGLLWTPHDPLAQTWRDLALGGPQAGHWLGFDGLGRDFFSRLWRGLGVTTLMASAAAALTLVLAALLLGAERSGPPWLRQALAVVVGVWVAVPTFLVGLVLLVFLAASPGTLILAAALGNIPFAYRQLRIAWLEQRQALYAQASEALGAPWRHLLAYTLWPNLWPDVAALLRLLFALSALELSGLAFLGLMGDPDFPELGAMLRQNQPYLASAPGLVLWPGALLSLLLLLLHLARSPSARR